MTKGFLGSADLNVPNTDVLLFTAAGAVGTAQTFNLRFANRDGFQTRVYVAIGVGGVPAAADWVNFGGMVPDNGILEETGFVASPGEKVWVKTERVLMSVRAHGL